MAKPKTLKLLDEKSLRKKYKDKAGLATSLLLPKDSSLWLPSRILALNWQLGGGIPYGKILEEFGYESTGKSLLALDFAYSTQQLGGIVLWDDAEGSFEASWAEQNGVDTSKVELYEENDVEGMSDWVRDMVIYYRNKLVNNEPILFVCDSIAALECEANIDADQSQGKAEMGNRAKAIYNFYRKRNSKVFKRYGVCVIMINQIRDKVGASMFEESTTTPGGAATKFYASQRLALIRSKQIKGFVKKDGTFKEDARKGHKVGQNIIFRVNKNKCAPPKDSIRTRVYFLNEVQGYYGFDRYAGLDEICINLGIIKKKGSRYYYKDKQLCNGRDNLVSAIHGDSKIRKKLIQKSKINTISKTQEKITALSKNVFPVKLRKNTSDDEE